jgi:hypothetical protein
MAFLIKGVGGLLLLVQDIGSVLCRCEFIRTRPNEFGPTAWIQRGDLNGYHYVGVGGANRPPPFNHMAVREKRIEITAIWDLS